MPARRRGAIILADQMVSSLGNFIAAALVASAATTDEFDGYAIAFAVYSLLLGFFRGIFGESSLSAAALLDDERIRRGVDLRALKYAPLCAAVVSAPAFVAVFLMHGSPFLLILFVGLPGLVLQDVARYIAFSARRTQLALVSDSVWAVFTLGGVLVVTHSHRSPTLIFAIWVAAGAAAGLLGLWWLLISVPSDTTVSWREKHLRLGLGFGAEFATGGGLGLLTIFVVGAIVGAQAVGDIRAGQIATAPLNVIFVGSTVILTGAFGSVLRSAPPVTLRRSFRLSSAMLLVITLVYALVVLAVPVDIGRTILGANWERSQWTGFLLAVGMAGTSLVVVSGALFRSMGNSAAGFRSRAIGMPVGVLATVIGSFVHGTSGACVGIAIGNAATAAVYLFTVRREIRGHFDAREASPPCSG